MCAAQRWNASRIISSNLQRERPQVFAMALVQTGLNDVAQGGKVSSTVSVHNAFGPGGGARGEGYREHAIFVIDMGMETSPALSALLTIIF